MKSSFTIIQDSNEKKPLLFPETLITLNDQILPQVTATGKYPSKVVKLSVRKERLGKAHKTMQRGDYYLDGYPNSVVIERKGNILEVANNLLIPRPRNNFINELDYLQSRCLWPVLLLEGTPAQYMTASGRVKVPEVALASLLRLCLERRIWLHMVAKGDASKRKKAGEWAAQIMVAGTVTRLQNVSK